MADNTQPFDAAALYKECVTLAANDGKLLMQALAAQARQALQQASATELDGGARHEMLEAVRGLSIHEQQLCERFPMALMGAFSEAIASDHKQRKAAPAPAPGAVIRFDELELMDESQVQESIELARAQQIAMATVDVQLGELNGLICAVLGLKTVQPDRNPLRPETYVEALRTALKLTNADNGVRVRWMQFMGGALGARLKPIYTEICDMLRERGVKPVGYVVTQTPQAGSPQGAGAPGAGGISRYGTLRGNSAFAPVGGGGGGGGAGGGTVMVGGTPSGPQYGQKALLTVDQLRRLLSGQFDAGRDSARDSLRDALPQSARGGLGDSGRGGLTGADPGLDFGDAEPPQPDFDHTVPAAFDALEEMRQTDRVLKRLSVRQASGGPFTGTPATATLDGLRRDAKGVGQALGLEVVNLMFENIAQDTHLLPPVQAVIRRVEPAYLRLALIDPRFFSDKQHVARRLLDEMTERSLGYATIVTPGFEPFLKSLREAAEVLAISQVRNVEPFEYALKTLEAEWGRQEHRESNQRDKAVHALLHAEQRNLLAERLAAEIRTRPGANLAPGEVMNFLCGPWSLVLAEARLADRKGSADPRGFMTVVNELIWSTQSDQSRINIERIQAMIPGLLERLREGLDLIAFPQSQTDSFGVLLLAIYENVLQPGNGRDSALPAPARGQDTQQDTQLNTHDPWLAPAEAQETGFLDITDSGIGRPGFRDTETVFESTSPHLPEEEREAKASERSKPPIPPGAWVELSLHDQTLRAQLTWSSPYGTLFMFTDSAGTTHSLTRRALDKLLARGSVTLISQGVVDGALDAVAQKAMRNTLDLSL